MLRLGCCVGMEKWALGDTLAEMLRHGDPKQKEAAARFWCALARAEIDAENEDFAKAAIRKASSTWPEILGQLRTDSALQKLL